MPFMHWHLTNWTQLPGSILSVLYFHYRQATQIQATQILIGAVLRLRRSINAAQRVVRGNVIVEVEGVKQTTLIAAALAHHPDVLRSLAR
jgi:hypothetical protein